MWGNSSPSTTIKDDWRTKWFPYPFGRSERCKLLDQWAAGKHQDNIRPPLLSDEWLKPNANLFFADYEAMMLAHCQSKWAKVITTDGQQEDAKSAGFQFGDSGYNGKIKIHAKWNKQMMAALLYYSSQIVKPELRTRLLRAKANSRDDLTWADAKRILTRYMESPDLRFKMNAVMCAKRADSEALLDWVQNILHHMHMEQCVEVEIKLPDSLWIDIAWGQMPPVE